MAIVLLFCRMRRSQSGPTELPSTLGLRDDFDHVASRWIGLYQKNAPGSQRWAIFQGYAHTRAIQRMQFVLALLRGLTDLNGLRVLEVGCGGGQYGARIIDHGGSWIGLDFSPHMLQHAQDLLSLEGRRLRLVQVDAFKVPVRSCSIDCVPCIGVMSYYPRERIADLAEELGRVLKPDGILITQSIALDVLTWIRSRLPRPCPSPIRLPGPVHPHPPNRISRLLRDKGLTLTHTIALRKIKLVPAGWICVPKEIQCTHS